jgi:hypothetical protein
VHVQCFVSMHVLSRPATGVGARPSGAKNEKSGLAQTSATRTCSLPNRPSSRLHVGQIEIAASLTGSPACNISFAAT